MKIYQIDTFTNKRFRGNAAAVCIGNNRLSEEVMQNISAENNLSETAFVVRKGDVFEIRWFTPEVEVDLCGHATLAAAYVLHEYYDCKKENILFETQKSGELSVYRQGDFFELDFPSDNIRKSKLPENFLNTSHKVPNEVYKGKTDLMLVYSNEDQVKNFVPDLDILGSAGARGVIITAPGNTVDFVSRFFAPQVGIAEDSVTGSSHTTLIPFWSQRLSKNIMKAAQLSKRGGLIGCEFLGSRVKISGQAVTYSIGEIVSDE